MLHILAHYIVIKYAWLTFGFTQDMNSGVRWNSAVCSTSPPSLRVIKCCHPGCLILLLKDVSVRWRLKPMGHSPSPSTWQDWDWDQVGLLQPEFFYVLNTEYRILFVSLLFCFFILLFWNLVFNSENNTVFFNTIIYYYIWMP